MKRLILLIITLGVFPALLFAADTGRTSALFMAPLAASGPADPLVEDILASELTAALQGAGISVAPGRLSLAKGADQPRLPDEQRVSYLLRGVNAGGVNVVVAAFYLVQGDTLVIQFALYDPAVRTMLGGVLTRARKGLTLFATVSEAVKQFGPAIQRYVEGGYQVEPPTGIVERIQVSGPPDGSRVVLLDREVGTMAGGTLVVPYTQFEVGSTIPVRVIKDGYHSYEGFYKLDSPQVSLSLPPLHRETRLDADLFWSFGEAMGVGFGGRIHIVPDSLFLGIEHYRSLDVGSLSTSLVRHYDTNVQVGQYIIFPYTSFIRLHLSLGVGLIMTDVAGIGGRDYDDWYVLVGDPTAELALGPVKVFFRPDLHYALGVGYNLLGREWIRTPFGIPPLTIGVRYSW
jgi:hypothetical protein